MLSLCSLLIAKTGYPALHVFTSSIPLSMAGAGYLSSSPISSKINPSYQSGKSFSASLIKYPASITSQSAGVQFPLLGGNGSMSLNYISYGIFQGYNDNAEPSREGYTLIYNYFLFLSIFNRQKYYLHKLF